MVGTKLSEMSFHKVEPKTNETTFELFRRRQFRSIWLLEALSKWNQLREPISQQAHPLISKRKIRWREKKDRERKERVIFKNRRCMVRLKGRDRTRT